jgi:protein subunit release factor A
MQYFDSLEHDKIDFKKNTHTPIIRFYDFNHNLISDHRLKKSYDKLNTFFKGDLFFLTEELKEHEYVKELEKFINL